MSNNSQQQQAWLQRLRDSGNPAAPQAAVQLHGLSQVRQMDTLAADGFDAASKNSGINSVTSDRGTANA